MAGRYRDPVHATAPRLASPDDADDAARLAAAARTESGPLNDVLRADIESPGPQSATWLVNGGIAHVQRDDRHAGDWLLGIDAPHGEWPALLATVAEQVAAHGGGDITWWRPGASDVDIELAAASGYSVARRQHELRAPLPLPKAVTAAAPPAADVELRTLRDVDIDQILAVNNTAFAGHHEQGDWTRAILDERLGQDWVDPALFVVAERDGRVVGFNWLKPHLSTAGDVARGEIYVIAVDPSSHGRGLGRLLAIDGLRRLHERGFATASLFVAADNEPALALYASLGFTTHRTDAALVAHLAPR
jgi:mycothiol synthase